MLAFTSRHPLLTILLLALFLRCIAAFATTTALETANRRFLIPGDAEGYWELAGTIKEGRPYAIYEPPRRVMRMPGFPALVAVGRFVGDDSVLAVRLILAGVSTVTCAATYLLGRILVSERIGVLSALFVAIHPIFIGFGSVVLSESTFALGLVLNLGAMAFLIRELDLRAHIGQCHTRRREMPLAVLMAVLAGLCAGGATYIRPTWLPASALFSLGLCIWFRNQKAFVVGSIVVVVTLITLAPWAWRNHNVTGHWVITTLWVGPSLYDGLNPTADGGSDMQFFEDDHLMDSRSEYEMDQEYRRRAIQFVKEQPLRTIQLVGLKLWRYWRPWPSAEQFSNWYAGLTVFVSYTVLMGLSCIGAWVNRRRVWLLALTCGPIIAFSAIHCVFVSSLRYRLPAEYPLCVLAALGAEWLATRRHVANAGADHVI